MKGTVLKSSYGRLAGRWGSNSTQGGVFDNASGMEEARHDSFGTKTMVISPSVEDVGEV